MTIMEVLSVLENDNLPQRVRCLARALLTAMLALDKYGHSMSYALDREDGSEVDHDHGRIARAALEEIRAVERRVH
jgi:hypothetical protein